MSWVFDFVRSTIGRKLLMAASGVLLLGFVIAHLSGNLLVYQGPEAMNAYGEMLRKFPAVLWGMRLGLLAAVAVHVWASTTLTLANRRARPLGYREEQTVASTYASRTMWWSGPLLATFIVYHLLHLTTGTAHPDFVPGDVYRNFVVGFQSPLASGFYILAMLALGLHIRHGAWSMLQTVGLSHPRFDDLRRSLATAVATLIVVVEISFPVSVLTGFVK